MAFRQRQFRARQLRSKKVETKESSMVDLRVVDEVTLRPVFRNIDYDITVRERAQRYQRRTERFCRA